jgi:hypothetical protein
MALADVVRTTRGHSLIKAISKVYGRDEDVPPLKPGDLIRCSSFPHLCAREEVLCSLRGIPRKNIISPDTNLTFLHGTALHWAVQNELLPALGVLLGKWRCDECGQTYGTYDMVPANISLRPDDCLRCGCHDFTYVEAYLKYDAPYYVHGHVDGVLQIPSLEGYGVLEVKSIGERFFHEVRQRPMIAHVVQVHLYLWLLGPAFKWAKLFYWCKGVNGLAGLREHLVERDEKLIDTIKATLESIWKGITDGTLPERICLNSTCPRASRCSVTERCFELGVGVHMDATQEDDDG